jgi:hypothetical protein
MRKQASGREDGGNTFFLNLRELPPLYDVTSKEEVYIC